MCNYVKFETDRILKIVTYAVQLCLAIVARYATMLWTSIGVTSSYSSRLFLCKFLYLGMGTVHATPQCSVDAAVPLVSNIEFSAITVESGY